MAQLVSPYSSSFGQFHPKQSTRLRQRTIPCFFIMCLTAKFEFDNLTVGYDSAPRKGCFSLPAICICYDSNSYIYTTTPPQHYKYFMLCA